MQKEFARRPLSVVAWMVIVLLLVLSLNAQATDACRESFTHGGDATTGLSFSASRTIPGLSPRDAMEQFKRVATEQGFKIGRDSSHGGQVDLVISQLPSIVARGFDLHFVADGSGKVALSTTLPAGMSARPESISSNMCEALNQLGDAAHAAPIDAGASGVFAPSPQQRTDLCLANFMAQGSTVQGQTFSTWSIGMAMDIAISVKSVKTFAGVIPGAHITTEVIHGSKASLTISLDNVTAVANGTSTIGKPDVRGFPMRVDLDASLDAASFTAHPNAEQDDISQDHLRFIACTLVAAAVSGAPLAPTEKASRFHFRNPFKNEQKAAQQKYDAQIDLMRSGRDLLYKRAERAGKAIVFMPMLNVDHKYAQASGRDLTPGSNVYPSFRFDQTTNMVWRNVKDHDDLIKVGEQVSLFEEGLFGSIQTVNANKSRYGIYIVDPGSYELTGLTYQLPHTTLPTLSAKRWTETPALGSATFAITRDAEFYDSQAWFDAQYQNVSVDDGSYCTATLTPGSDQGCVNWQNSYHNETRLADSGGWRTVTQKGYAGGLGVSVKLTRPFASFEAKSGEVLVTDGLSATPDSIATDRDACHQAGESLINCGFDSLTLYRIPGTISDLTLSAETAQKVPVVAGFVARAVYRPLIVHATKLEEIPGTYEAAWAAPFRSSAH